MAGGAGLLQKERLAARGVALHGERGLHHVLVFHLADGPCPGRGDLVQSELGEREFRGLRHHAALVVQMLAHLRAELLRARRADDSEQCRRLLRVGPQRLDLLRRGGLRVGVLDHAARCQLHQHRRAKHALRRVFLAREFGEKADLFRVPRVARELLPHRPDRARVIRRRQLDENVRHRAGVPFHHPREHPQRARAEFRRLGCGQRHVRERVERLLRRVALAAEQRPDQVEPRRRVLAHFGNHQLTEAGEGDLVLRQRAHEKRRVLARRGFELLLERGLDFLRLGPRHDFVNRPAVVRSRAPPHRRVGVGRFVKVHPA